MIKLDTQLSEQFLGCKELYDSLNLSLSMSRIQGIDENILRVMVGAKQQAKQQYIKGLDYIVTSMSSVDTNMVDLGKGWYGIVYYNGKRSFQLRVEVLKKEDMALLERKVCRGRGDYTSHQLEEMLPAYIDEAMSGYYTHHIQRLAEQHLLNYAGIKLESVHEDQGSTRVSHHACIRWVQRKMLISNELQAEEYTRLNHKKIEEGILEQYSKAELIWKDDEGIEYSLDDHNIVYIIGNNTIITLYEEDFGFSKSINRMIVLEQLQVLKGAKEVLDGETSKHSASRDTLMDEITQVDSEVELLQSKMDMLLAHKSALLTQKKSNEQSLKLSQDTFKYEFNKLFRRWSHDKQEAGK